MTQTTTREQAREIVRKLSAEADRAEGLSRRNGWDTANQPSVYPRADLIDTLLDIRTALVGTDNQRAAGVVDEALSQYGRRPGACTTREVRELCDRLLDALPDTGTTS